VGQNDSEGVRALVLALSTALGAFLAAPALISFTSPSLVFAVAMMSKPRHR